MAEKMVRRYTKRLDIDEGDLICDAVWTDRTTGKVVLRYDAADPANTDPEYGAVPDSECFKNRGLDMYEMVPISRCLREYL